MPSSDLYHCFLSKYIHDQAALVSYHDPDAGLSDEERSPVPMDLESDAEAEGEGEGNGEDAEAEVNITIPFENIKCPYVLKTLLNCYHCSRL